MTEEPRDEALMLSYARGKAAAFDVLYGRYRKPLYGYFMRHVSDPVLANDLYQGCWEKVIAARGRYNDKAPFRAWLFRIAHNHLVDHYRARRETEPLPPELPGQADWEDSDAGSALDEAARQQRFRAALQALPGDQRDTFLLRMEGGLGLADLAQATGVNAETAKSRLRYATRKLKEVLQS